MKVKTLNTDKDIRIILNIGITVVARTTIKNISTIRSNTHKARAGKAVKEVGKAVKEAANHIAQKRH